jgi:hypothetical protein
MDKTGEKSGGDFDMLNKDSKALRIAPKVIAPPAPGQKLLTEEEKNKIKNLRKTVEEMPQDSTAPAGKKAKEEESEDTEKTGFSALLEGNNKYIVIAVALLAVYFLFIKKR